MSRSRLLMATASVAVVLTMITGCGQIRESLPSMERVLDVAKESALEPETWVPLTAAAAIGLAGVDDNISDWASDNTPIFGSQGSADQTSDDLRNALIVGMAVSSVFAPVSSSADDGFRKRRVVANALGFSVTGGVVQSGKLIFQRERPNERDDESFPSGHSGSSFSSAVLIEQNLNATIERPWLRKSIKAGTTATAAAVAWARVEAQEHFPVDVLVSAALGNFFAKVFYKSFLTEDGPVVPPVAIEAGRDGFLVRVDRSF